MGGGFHPLKISGAWGQIKWFFFFFFSMGSCSNRWSKDASTSCRRWTTKVRWFTEAEGRDSKRKHSQADWLVITTYDSTIYGGHFFAFFLHNSKKGGPFLVCLGGFSLLLLLFRCNNISYGMIAGRVGMISLHRFKITCKNISGDWLKCFF